jgi:uncharacterized protein with GYD domain
MPDYIVLFNWTDQGIKNFKDSPKRVDAANQQWEHLGVRVKEIHWTLGPYDLVGQVEAPNDEALTAALLQLGAGGNVRSTTLRAFGRDEYIRLIEGS